MNARATATGGRVKTAHRRRVACVAGLLAAGSVLAACSDNSSTSNPPTPNTPPPTAKAGSGPFFGACGGVTTDEVVKATGFAGLINTVNNPSACEWVTTAEQLGPQVSFNWYRGSPIGRERATEQLSRDSVTDKVINGNSGFIASSNGICELGINFGSDFFEWSVSAGAQAGNDQSAPTTDQICGAATDLSTDTVKRGQK